MLTSLVNQQNKILVQEDKLKFTIMSVHFNKSSVIISTHQLSQVKFVFSPTLHCKLYINYDKRCQRAQQLGMYGRCLSKRHSEKDCPRVKGKLPFPCNSCQATKHVIPMYKNIMLSISSAKRVNGNGESRWLVVDNTSDPVVNILFTTDKGFISLLALLNTETQFSLICLDKVKSSLLIQLHLFQSLLKAFPLWKVISVNKRNST